MILWAFFILHAGKNLSASSFLAGIASGRIQRKYNGILKPKINDR